jgi:periplasmic protein TonB
MKTKKSKKANLENYRTIFLQIGIILTLSAILFAFEWKSEVEIETLLNNKTSWIDVESLPPVTMPKQELKMVKPPSFEMIVVDDEKDIEIKDDLQDLFKDIEDYKPIDFGDIESGDEVVDDDPFIVAEFMPTFNGKDRKYYREYIAENIKFPAAAIENGITGTVYVSFVVDKDGSVTDIQILRGVHPTIDKAVLKVIKNSPKWDPGMNNGRYVKVRCTISIAFKLQ